MRAVAADPRLADLRNVEAGIIVDLLLSFRAVGTTEGCEEMIALHDRMPRELQQARMVREQLGFALNRAGRRAEAEKVLTEVIARVRAEQRDQRPARPRLQGHLGGRQAAGRGLEARGHLKRAIASLPRRLRGRLARRLSRHQRGDADGDVEPARPGASRAAAGGPLCRRQRIRADESGTGDYWDQATLLELAVIGNDQDGAMDAAAAALAVVTEPWQPATTARNLRLIREAREAGGEDAAWIAEIETALADAEARLREPTA